MQASCMFAIKKRGCIRATPFFNLQNDSQLQPRTPTHFH
jgi:hypothetical protein